MSDDVKPRSDSDPAAQVQAELRGRLGGMDQEALLELCAQLVTTYVLEGVLPLARATDATDLPADSVGEESFAQMLKRLKASKKDATLEKFFIDGENISVRIDGYGILPVSDYRRPNTPGAAAAAPQPRRESVPGSASSIYNRALYQPDQTAPAPARGALPAPAQTAAPGGVARTQPAAPGQAAQPGQASQPGQPGQKKDEPKNDRFSLIELE